MWRITRAFRFRLKPDPSLVSLPEGVGCVEVYRNAVDGRAEQLIWDELNLVLEREGQTVFTESSTPQNKVLKHTYLELHGNARFTEVKSWQRREVRRLPGLVWSPTLLSLLHEWGPPLLGAVPDTARVVEHALPGYEMHTEHPTVGCGFLYLSLLSDTVLHLDDEATERRGAVLLPQRSLMRCSGEARWGWRFGEAPREVHTFTSPGETRRRRVETEMRLSVQLWRFTPQLLDARLLQDRVEQSVRRRETATRESPRPNSTLTGEDETVRDTRSPVLPNVAGDFTSTTAPPTSGVGPLGGEYTPSTNPNSHLQNVHSNSPSHASGDANGASKTMEGLAHDFVGYKQQFKAVHDVLREMKAMQDAGQPVNDMWLKQKVLDGQRDTAQDKRDGFDPSDVEGTWDRADAKARFYKAKLKGMDYDGTGTMNNVSGMPDVTADAPLDMQKTIRKIAPLVKDGEKILAGLPSGRAPGK